MNDKLGIDLGARLFSEARRRVWMPGLSFLLLALGATAGCDVRAAEGLDSGVSGDACRTELAVLCDGDNLMVRDACTGVSTLVEACAGACYRGACVECAPEAGRLCVDGEIHDVDSCGNVGGVLETCSEECRAGACVGSDCAPGASTVCLGDTVYSRDSCGNLENAIAVCSMGCSEGACAGCTPSAYTICYRGDIYELDSCWVLGGVAEDCAETCLYDAGSIMCATGVTCTPGASRTCFLGDIHYVDSCGSVEPDIAEDCPSGCDNMNGGCLPCRPIPMGTTCSDGDVHELLGGCSDMAPSVGALIETCAQGCSDGACQTGPCVPGVGTVCSGGNVHLVDSCGTVGERTDTCTAGCERGACTATDAGVPTVGGTTCSCAPPTADGLVECSIGATRCTGCLGLDGFCDDASACRNLCPSEFSCSGGNVLLNGAPVMSCSGSPEWPLLCSLVCAL